MGFEGLRPLIREFHPRDVMGGTTSLTFGYQYIAFVGQYLHMLGAYGVGNAERLTNDGELDFLGIRAARTTQVKADCRSTVSAMQRSPVSLPRRWRR